MNNRINRNKRIWNSMIALSLLVVVFMLTLVGVFFVSDRDSASADSPVSQRLVVENKTVHRGSTFSITISVTGNHDAGGLSSLRLIVQFNKHAMKLVSYTRKYGVFASGSANTDTPYNPAKWDTLGYDVAPTDATAFTVLFDSTKPTTKANGDGELCTLTFESLANCPLDYDGNNLPIATDYEISIHCDANNTRDSQYNRIDIPTVDGDGQEVNGSVITTLPGQYKIALFNYCAAGETPTYFVPLIDGSQPKEISDAMAQMPGAVPQRASDSMFDYTFSGWVQRVDTDYAYDPTFTATPIPYDVTFHQGIMLDDDSVSYDDPRLATFISASYQYGSTSPVSIPYGKIIVYDDYKPEYLPAIHPDYTFCGWFTDLACSVPVNFATMPDHNVNLYGCYKLNVDKDLTTANVVKTTTTIDGKYVYADFDLISNFGFNALTFTIDYDDTVLKLEGFLFDSTCIFHDGSLSAIEFPAINASIQSHSMVDGWQYVESGYEPTSLRFGFMNTSSNTYEKGRLIRVKFSALGDGSSTIGVSLGVDDTCTPAVRDIVTRYKTDGSLWRTELVSVDASIEVVFVEAPTVDPLKTYTYNGLDQQFEFASTTDSQYYTITNNTRKLVGTYTGVDAVKVTLNTASDKCYVWDGTASNDPLYFDFVIEKKQVIKPTASEDTYVYTGSKIIYAFSANADNAYYIVTGTEETDAGAYSVIATLKDTVNTEWADETTSEGKISAKVYPFVIAKQVVLAPSITSKNFTGYLIVPTIPASDYYTVTENLGGTQVGSYPVILTLADTLNYIWDGGIDGVAEKTVYFEITLGANSWETNPLSLCVPTKVYDGNPIVIVTPVPTFGKGTVQVTYEANVNGSWVPMQAGDIPTNAGNYKVHFYVPAGDGDSYPVLSDEIAFTIAKGKILIPEETEKQYVYTGSPITYEFKSNDKTTLYSVAYDENTLPGNHQVCVSIVDKDNYVWEDETNAPIYYDFVIRSTSISDTTGDNGYVVTIANALGFLPEESLSAELSSETASAIIAEASTYANGKCLLAKITLDVLANGIAVNTFSGTYNTTLQLPASVMERTGIKLLQINGTVSEIEFIEDSDGHITFASNGVYDVIILADHIFDQEVADTQYLKTAATCTEKAVYYKSCICGESGETYGGETFVVGEPLGHDYDLTNITWVWTNDCSSCVAKLECKRDSSHHDSIDASVIAIERQVPGAETDGFVKYKATITIAGVDYTDEKTLIVPSSGHTYSSQPTWEWVKTGYTYTASAKFVCDCGEKTKRVAAFVNVTITADKLIYTAEVEFNATIYTDTMQLPRPVVIFDFDDGVTPQQSVVVLPGERVNFPEVPVRSGYQFYAWLSEKGTLLNKLDDDTSFIEYIMAFDTMKFTAQWKQLSNVLVNVTDADGHSMEDVLVIVYDGDNEVVRGYTDLHGKVSFDDVWFGNYKLVAQYKYTDDVTDIIRTTSLDVYETAVETSIVLTQVRFNTKLEGDGSAEGLENIITEHDREKISDETIEGTINEITITQRRVPCSDNSIENEISHRMNQDFEDGKGKLVDFVDVTIIKETTIRNASGIVTHREEEIKEAADYQTNIYPISTALREQIARVNGSVDNIFIYKRHEFSDGSTVVTKVKKVKAPEAGEDEPNFECYYIKNVAGIDYIVIRQREYSVFGMGVSGEVVLLTNEILTLTLANWTYSPDGSSANSPIATAKYGTPSFTYSTEEDGTYTSEKPNKAGTYYVKATVAPSDTYNGAFMIKQFTIARKVVVAPDECQYEYIYNGAPQTYVVDASTEYTVSGNVQTEAGTHVVTISLVDPTCYIWNTGNTNDITYDFVIAKREISSISGISFKNRSFLYNGKSHSIKISGTLPDGVTVTYKGNGEHEIGKYYVTATFHSDNPNYAGQEDMVAIMRIRINWIWIIILLVVIVGLTTATVVFSELMRKKTNDDNGGDLKGNDNAVGDSTGDEAALDNQTDDADDADEGENANDAEKGNDN